MNYNSPDTETLRIICKAQNAVGKLESLIDIASKNKNCNAKKN